MSRDERILSLTGVVLSIARGVHRTHGGELQDMIQDGWLGAIRAVDRYDPAHGASLATYGKHRIRGAIMDGIRSRDHLTSAHRRALHDRPDTSPRAPLSIDRLSDGTDLRDLLSDDVESLRIESRLGEMILADAIRLLPSAEAYIVRQHYLHGRSQASLSNAMGVTPGRVSQLARQARTNLEESLAEGPLRVLS